MNLNICPLQAAHRPALARLLGRIQEFDAEDCALALELADQVLGQPGQKDYRIRLAYTGQPPQLAGFICFGPTPLTEGTYDLYWIAVDPAFAGQGIGSRLMAAMEAELRAQAGRLLLIETSSSPVYAGTRQFYLKNGCSLVETIPDFYHPGEDRVTYQKRL